MNLTVKTTQTRTRVLKINPKLKNSHTRRGRVTKMLEQRVKGDDI